MKLFRIDVRFKRKHGDRVGVETVVHAAGRTAAKKRIFEKYSGCTIERVIELPAKGSRHFVIADILE